MRHKNVIPESGTAELLVNTPDYTISDTPIVWFIHEGSWNTETSGSGTRASIG